MTPTSNGLAAACKAALSEFDSHRRLFGLLLFRPHRLTACRRHARLTGITRSTRVPAACGSTSETRRTIGSVFMTPGQRRVRSERSVSGTCSQLV